VTKPILLALVLNKEGLTSKQLNRIVRGVVSEDDLLDTPDHLDGVGRVVADRTNGTDCLSNNSGSAIRSLIRRLRQLLGNAQGIVTVKRLPDGTSVYVLDHCRVRCDVWEFKDLLAAADSYERRADSLAVRARLAQAPVDVSHHSYHHHLSHPSHPSEQSEQQERELREIAHVLRQEAISLYGGDLNGGLGALLLEGSFAEQKDDLKALYARALLQTANYWHHQALIWRKRAGKRSLCHPSRTNEKDAWRKARDLYGQAIAADPFDEAPYAGGMICCAQLSLKQSVEALFRNLCELLHTEMEDRPASETVRIYRACLRQLETGVPIPDPEPDWCRGLF
jgi:hypothetical protein